MIDSIKDAIYDYQALYKDMPNTVLIPIDMYCVIKDRINDYIVYNGGSKAETIFGMNIIAIENEKHIRAIKVI